MLNHGNEITRCAFNKPELNPEEAANIGEYDVLIFAFPLYVDAIPSHLLSCLIELEGCLAKAKKDTVVYAIVNCGFYEGQQNRLALAMMENWCDRAGLKWGQGIGIGAGGILAGNNNIPLGQGPNKNLGKALSTLVHNVLHLGSDETIFITANFPKVAYKLAAEWNWRQAAKLNGLTVKELSLQK